MPKSMLGVGHLFAQRSGIALCALVTHAPILTFPRKQGKELKRVEAQRFSLCSSREGGEWGGHACPILTFPRKQGKELKRVEAQRFSLCSSREGGEWGGHACPILTFPRKQRKELKCAGQADLLPPLLAGEGGGGGKEGRQTHGDSWCPQRQASRDSPMAS